MSLTQSLRDDMYDECCRFARYDEFCRLARDTISEEMRELGQALQRDLLWELQGFCCSHSALSTTNVADSRLRDASDGPESCMTPHGDSELLPTLGPHLLPDALHGMMAPAQHIADGSNNTGEVESASYQARELSDSKDPLQTSAPGTQTKKKKMKKKKKNDAEDSTRTDVCAPELDPTVVRGGKSLRFEVTGWLPDSSPEKIPVDYIGQANGWSVPGKHEAKAEAKLSVAVRQSVSADKVVAKPSALKQSVSVKPPEDRPMLGDKVVAKQSVEKQHVSVKLPSEDCPMLDDKVYIQDELDFIHRFPHSISSTYRSEAWTIEQVSSHRAQRHLTTSTQQMDLRARTSRHTQKLAHLADPGIYQQWATGRITLGKAISKLIASDWFDYSMGSILFLNALVIGMEVDLLSRSGDDHLPTSYRILDGLFCFVFFAEVVARSFEQGLHSYLTGTGWRWNVFDAIVVAFTILDEIVKLFLIGSSVQTLIDDMGVIRTMRLAKLVRLIRMVRLLPELKSMVYLICASMNAFLWTIALLFTMIYCVAVYYTELAIDMVKDEGVSLTVRESLKLHFGSVARSLLSLFQAISGGDDWRNFVDPFEHYGSVSHVTNSLFFVVYVSFASLVMLNLVTGVFVEGAQRLIQEEELGELVRHVRQLFNLTDLDLSGQVSFEEFESQISSDKFDEFLDSVDLQELEAKSFFQLLDTDNSGMLDVAEFVQGCIRLRGPARSVDLNALKHNFDALASQWNQNLSKMDAKISKIAALTEDAHQRANSTSNGMHVIPSRETLVSSAVVGCSSQTLYSSSN